ncbi:MAG: nucleotide exchange factor GrpE [Promethearchaeota archaeon]
MVFGDYLDGFFGPRKLYGKGRTQYEITPQEFEELRLKAERYDSLVKEVKTLRLENRKLRDTLKDLEETESKLKEVQEKAEKYYKALLRSRADFDNYRKNVERDKENFKFYAMETILKKLLRHYEDLHRANGVLLSLEIPESVQQGFQMLINNFEKLMQEEGITPMEVEGKEFDPYKHEALMVEENDELPENTIIEELDKGYLFNNKVLRPAKVKISKQSNKNKQNYDNKENKKME